MAAAVRISNRHGGDHGTVLGHGDAVTVVGLGVDGSKSRRDGGVAVAVAFLSRVCLSNVATTAGAGAGAATSRLREIDRTPRAALVFAPRAGGHVRLPPPSTRRIIGHGRVVVFGAHSAAEGADDSVDEAAASRGGSSGGEGAEHGRDGGDGEGSLGLWVEVPAMVWIAMEAIVMAVNCVSTEYFA